MPSSVIIHASVPLSTVEALDRVARVEHRSRANVVRVLLAEGLLARAAPGALNDDEVTQTRDGV